MFVKGGIEGDEYFASLLNYTPESTLGVDLIMRVRITAFLWLVFNVCVQAPCVTKITTDDVLIRDAIHNSKSFVVCNNIVKSSAIKLEQNTLILREMVGAQSGDIVRIFSNAICPDGLPCPTVTSVREDVNDIW